MRHELRPELACPYLRQREDRSLLVFEVHRQFETLRQQGLHHQPHLVLRSIALCLGFNFEKVRAHPFRGVRQGIRSLKRRQLIGESNECPERKSRVEAAASRLRVIRAKAEGWEPRGSSIDDDSR